MQKLLTISAVIVIAGLTCGPSQAQTPYPTRTVEIVVPYAPGGSTDFVARLIAQKLQERWSQSAVVVNKPGAGGTIGVATAMRAAPDGYTLLASFTSELVLAPQMNPNVKYTVGDFEPIAVTGIVPVVLIVSKNVQANTFRELIAEVRREPGKYTFAGSIASPSHILGSWLNRLEKLEIRHVPSRGGAQGVGDVVGGHVDMFYAGTAVAKSSIESGTVKAMAITGVRSAAMPDIPTFAEAGLADFDLASWTVMLAPKGTPADIVDKVRKEVLDILADPQVRKALADQGIEPSPTQDVRAFLAAERDKFARVVKELGITAGN
jgi:tripartite-type tricarboxylate transporter receptor subunit TctC